MVTAADLIQRNQQDKDRLKIFHDDLMAFIATRPLVDNDNMSRAVEAIAAEIARLEIKVIQGEALILSHHKASRGGQND